MSAGSIEEDGPRAVGVVGGEGGTLLVSGGAFSGVEVILSICLGLLSRGMATGNAT